MYEEEDTCMSYLLLIHMYEEEDTCISYVRPLTCFIVLHTLNVKARAWPAMFGAHLVRGIPEVVNPAPTSVLLKEAAAYFDTHHYQQLFVQVHARYTLGTH